MGYLLCDLNISDEVDYKMGPRPQAGFPTSSEVHYSVLTQDQSKS